MTTTEQYITRSESSLEISINTKIKTTTSNL